MRAARPRRTMTRRWIVILLVFGMVPPSLAFPAPQPQGADARPPACSGEKLFVLPGDSIRLSVQPQEALLTAHSWQADAGTVRREGSNWTWTLSGAAPGIHVATYGAAEAGTAGALCRIEAFVLLPNIEFRGGSTRQAARALLGVKEREPKGFGLYSYILILRPPDAENRERHLRLLEEYLKFPDVEQLERNISRYRNMSREDARRTLNATFLFVTAAVPAPIATKWDAQDFRPVAEWILTHYDFARAQAMAGSVARTLQGGPYIVSTLQPLGSQGTSEVLLQDQSAVPAAVVAFWMREFLYQSAQERYWEPPAARRLMLRMRTMVAVAAEGWPHVRDATGELIKWVGSAGKS